MRSLILAAVAAVAALAMPSTAEAQRVRAGVLTCNLDPTIGLIIGSQQQASCVFNPSRPGAPNESYSATLSRVGLDLGVRAGGTLVWGVFAATSKLPPRVLAGTYVGAAGDASVGVGVGANVLVGGSNRTVSLQPLSVSGDIGVNLALGVAGLRLR
jgi:hypothetical protein